ncbi:MAG: hypothetical protein EOM54_13825 [Clostridia bacterium]|nr:hypothetical protein [Clostridia bacterium]
MPGRDGTGPMGAGSITGRGFGFCAGGANKGPGPGFGFACGRGLRGGFGMGRAAGQTSAMARKDLLSEQRDLLKKRLDVIEKQIESL